MIISNATINGVQYYEFNNITGFSGGTGGFSVNNGPSTLPIKLLDLYDDEMNSEYIALDWSTATEFNNDSFEVLRSSEGINFKNIGCVYRKGNTAVINDYSYEDREVSKGITYEYKLKQVDYDGALEYYHIVSAQLEGGVSFNTEALIPNQISSSKAVSLNLFSSRNELINVSIYNQIGMLIKASKKALIEVLNTLKLGIDNLESEAFFINSEGLFGRETRKLLVVN